MSDKKRQICIDQGHGWTKVSVICGGIIENMFKKLDSIVELHPSNEESIEAVNNDSVINYKGKKYLIGGSSLQAVSKDNKVLDITTYEELKYVAPMVIKKYLDLVGGEFNQITLTISMAYLRNSGDYKDYVASELNIDADILKVIPQGVGCKVALDNIGFNVLSPTDKKKINNYLLIDGGFSTIDVGVVIDGRILPTNVRGFKDEGVIKIVKSIKESLDTNLGIEHSISKVREILEKSNYNFRGSSIPVKEIIDKAVNNYIVGLKDFLEKEYKSTLDAIEKVVIFGGLAELIRSRMDVWDTLYDSKNFVLIPESHAEYYNSLGGLYI